MSNLENLLSVGRISPQCVLAPYFGESSISRYILSNWDYLLSDGKMSFWTRMIYGINLSQIVSPFQLHGFLFKVLCQHEHHHDVDDRHDYVDDDFDAATLMVIMMMLMVVKIYARFYHFLGGK